MTHELEDVWRQFVGCNYAIAVANCTVGLETSLRALKIGAGDEVIVPDYTYPATADVVAIVGAKIVIVDVDPKSMLVDYDALEGAITARTKAIIPVSIFGNPLDFDRLNTIKEKHNLYIIEDAACSIGAKYNEVFVGNLADISVFSLHPRKFITTGEGGIITTNNPDWAEWMISYKTFGSGNKRSRSNVVFERIGTNYKLSSIQAAVGLVQMRHIEHLLKKRREISETYYALLSKDSRISFPQTVEKGHHSWQSCCIFLENRDEVISRLRQKGIEVQIGTYALHMHAAFRGNSNCRIVGEMTGSRYAFDHCLTLPVYYNLTSEDQEYVVDELLKVVK